MIYRFYMIYRICRICRIYRIYMIDRICRIFICQGYQAETDFTSLSGEQVPSSYLTATA